MRARPRVIPILLLHGGRLVKTIRFRRPTYIGDPLNAIRIFNDKGADELVVLDIGRDAARRGPDMARLKTMAAECFMPLAYGGGVTTPRQAEELVSLGIEKVCVNTAWVRDPSLLPRMADALGRQSVVAVVDAKRRRGGGGHVAMVGRGRRSSGLSPVELAKLAVQRGAGEILVQSVDRDGTMSGYDLGLVRSVAAAVDVPVVAAGGAAGLQDLAAAFQAGASAAAAGALFVFKGPHRAVLITMPDQGALAAAGLAP